VSSGTGTLRFDLTGTSLQLFLDGNLLVSATDATFTTGSVGMRAVGLGTSFDNFSAT
jgi:hypothetical protein